MSVSASAYADAVQYGFRDRLELVKRLRSVRPGLLTALTALTLLGSLMPAATAIAFAALLGGVHGAADRLVAATVVPLTAYLMILLTSHVIAAVSEPLRFLAIARIDGDHRADLARLTATSPTIGALERADVQALIWQARADPETFIEGTPGPGALAQINLIGRVLTLLSSGAVLSVYAWWLVPLVVVPATVLHWLDLHEAAGWRRVWRGVVEPGMRADVWADAIVSPAEGKEIRVFGLSGWAVDRIHHYVSAGFHPMWSVGRHVLARLWQRFLLVLVPLLAAYIAVAAAAAEGRSSIAVAAAVFTAATGVYQALTEPNAQFLGNAVAVLQAYERVRTALPSESAPAAVHNISATGAPLVRFEDVAFAYPGTDRRILDRLDLEIRPGELLAIVGLNGAGKSTLIKLLATLYEPTAGRITADGADLAALGPRAWRARIAVVFQDFVRYHLSAADNVVLGNAAVPRDDEALAAAARDAGLTDLVEGLPMGWDTPLARTRTGGVDLSGGQWQQVVLARALYAVRTGAGLLVLDEPTAHLDVRTEFEVFQRLAAHKGSASVVLISHRLSTVRRADRIVLLEDGRITESGRHEELMARGGRYQEMFATQAARFQQGYDDRIEEGV